MIASKTTTALVVLLLAIAVSLGACGSSAETGTGESTASSPAPVAREKSRTGEEGDERQSVAGAARFESEGGDNSIQEFGSEGSGTERAAAAAVLHRYLDARAEHDWEAACAQLAPGLSETLAQQLWSKDGKHDCAAILARLTAAVPASALRRAAVADVGALRVEGEQAFLLFHGDNGAYFMPMVQEDGAWRVAAIAASPLL